MGKQYTFTVYHDTEENAAEDSRSGPRFRSLRTAKDAARRAINDQWQSATVEVGDWVPAVPYVSPGYWAGDGTATVGYIGPGKVWDPA